MKFPDKNFINNVILLIILLLLANYLSNGSIINVIIKYYNLLKDYICNMENFQNTFFKDNRSINQNLHYNDVSDIIYDNDFKYIYNNNSNLQDITKEDDPSLRKLYKFLQKLITVDTNYTNLTLSRTTEKHLSQAEKDSIRKNLLKSLNNDEFEFNNLMILDELVYFENPRGKDMKPFRISGDASINGIPIGNLVIYIEAFIKFNSPVPGPIKSGFFQISRVKLIKRELLEKEPRPQNEFISETEIEIPEINIETDIAENNQVSKEENNNSEEENNNSEEENNNSEEENNSEENQESDNSLVPLNVNFTETDISIPEISEY